VKPTEPDLTTHLARARVLVAQVTRTDPTAAHARYFVGRSLLSYAEKLDNSPGDPIVARTCGMLQAEYRGDVSLGTWSASDEPQAVWAHVFGSKPSREW
jgi:hypothetical protein